MGYKKINNIVGWAIFAISLATYLLTMSPTASFWDCGEFISCSNELMVPHPPGPPIFLLIGRFFAMFAFNDPTMIAYMVNLVSVFSATFTVLFTFWIITILAKKMVANTEVNPPKDKTWLIMFAGAVGALACNFTDSFWFNGVEAEVYAMSSLCTAAVVWLMFKWEARADQPQNLQWIVLIAFVVGLSIGVHLLNLLAIPALAFIYYFKRYDFSWIGAGITFAVSVAILAIVQYGIIQYTIEFVWFFEKIFTGYERIDAGGELSGLGMSMGTGAAVFFLLMFASIAAGLFYTAKKNLVLANTVILSLLVIVIGYSSYTVIFIRANSDVPLNENDPGNIPSMLSYMKREQYGDHPLFRGPLYNNVQRGKQKQGRANFVKMYEEFWFAMEDGDYKLDNGTSFTIDDGKIKSSIKFPKNAKLEDGTRVKLTKDGKRAKQWTINQRYIYDGHKVDYEYPSRMKVFFPRMYSSGHYNYPQHPFGYKKYVSNLGQDPKDPNDDRPTVGENWRFFFDYQIRHMYLRYFGWNFIGRAGDKQEDPWESGLAFWKTSNMPDELADDPGKNHYYGLPLLLGLFGLVWHSFSRKKDAATVGLLFFFTGFAILLYLNQTPTQPRERDYSYAGSFQTFCIWIGLGVIGVHELLQKYLKGVTHYVAGGLCLIVPLIMGFEGWDDHSRAVRYVAPDSAYNLLNSCKKNALIFTNGDNDTFPLWYLQEVESVRTDVRVVNLSLLNTDWYIDHMKKKSNDSPALPISMKEFDYKGDRNAIKSFGKGQIVKVPVKASEVMANGTVKKGHEQYMVSPLEWKVRTRGGSRSYLLKQDVIIMDIIMTNARNGWERPIYFSSTIPPSSYMNLTDYFIVEGLAYRLSPVKLPKGNDPYRHGAIDTEVTHDLITNVFKYRELDNPKLYLDEHIRRTIIGNLQSTVYRVVNAYLERADKLDRQQNAQLNLQIRTLEATGDAPEVLDSLKLQLIKNEALILEYEDKGKELLSFLEEKMPYDVIAMEPVFQLFIGNAYYRLGETEKMLEHYEFIENKVVSIMDYHKEIGENWKYQDRYISALDLLTRYYDNIKDYEAGARVAEKLLSYSGKAEHDALLQNMRNKLGQENSGQQ